MAYTGTVYSPSTSKTLAVTTAGTDTTTVNHGAVYRLTASVDMFVKFSTTSTSDGTSMILLGSVPEYVRADSANISAKVASGSGTLYITEML